jgi:large conductance mechanosensitive channel
MLNFIIVAWVLFRLMRVVNRLVATEPPKAPPVTKQEQLLTEIRDLLKNR